MGDKLYPSPAEFEGKRRQRTAGPNRSLSGQVHAANPAPLFNLDAFDIPVGIDLKTDHGLDGTFQLAQRGFQPVLPTRCSTWRTYQESIAPWPVPEPMVTP